MIAVKMKRPDEATPAKILALKAAGLLLREIGQLYGISPQRVCQLLAEARKTLSAAPQSGQAATLSNAGEGGLAEKVDNSSSG